MNAERRAGIWSGRACSPLYLLKGTLLVHALGPHKHPAVPEGQVPDVPAAQLAEELPGLIIHPVGREKGEGVSCHPKAGRPRLAVTYLVAGSS